MSRNSGAAKSSPSARRKARRFAMQALYQWHMAGADLANIEAQFRTDQDMSKVDNEYFHDILHGVPRELSALDQLIEPLLDRDKTELTPVEQSILRLAAFELAHRIDVPYKVVINEAVELAKEFGATDGHKYVNGVVDKLATSVRTVEVKHSGKKGEAKSNGSHTPKRPFKAPTAKIITKGSKKPKLSMKPSEK